MVWYNPFEDTGVGPQDIGKPINIDPLGSLKDRPKFKSRKQRERAEQYAAALERDATSTAPLGHWTQALAQGVKGILGGLEEREIDKDEAARREYMASALEGKMSSEDLMKEGALYGVPELTELGEYQQKRADKLAGGDDEYGLNPVWTKDADGNWQLFQPSRGGGSPQQMQFPEGFSPQPNVQYHNTGTGFVGTEAKGGAVTGETIPIDVSGKAAQTEIGQAQGEAQATLPVAENNLQTTLTEIDQVLAHPGLEAGTGTIQGQVPDAIAGFMNADVADFRDRVNQLKGGSFLQAYTTLKGGGAIANAEGTKAEQAIARLGIAKNETDFKQALIDYKGAIQRGFAAMQRKAGGNAPSPPPTGSGAGGAQEYNWTPEGGIQ